MGIKDINLTLYLMNYNKKAKHEIISLIRTNCHKLYKKMYYIEIELSIFNFQLFIIQTWS